jgi:Ser/Thr protein kinase RdoA (MazF antagonist)
VEAVRADKAGRLHQDENTPGRELHSILSEIDRYGVQMCRAERLHREGKLPKRICHCDTKVNNMMFDEDGSVLCVIDLDTVMPSYVFSDFGDFLRTAANPVAEDSPELDKVDFDMDIFKAFSRGYIRGTRSFLTPVERENLPYAACLFPFMQAVRFFADYLNGDTYYKISYPEHNLVRTRNQMKLFASAMEKVPLMQDFLCTL